jgi:hypothetical protein
MQNSAGTRPLDTLGIGLKNAGEKVSGSIAWTAILVVWVVIVLLGMGVSWAFPSFIS